MDRPSSVLTDGRTRVDTLKALIGEQLAGRAVLWNKVVAEIEKAGGAPVIAWQLAPPTGRDHGDGWSASLRFTAFSSTATEDEISEALFALWESIDLTAIEHCTDLTLACGPAVRGQDIDSLRRGSLTVHIREVRTG